jgi:glutamate dehydrogenase
MFARTIPDDLLTCSAADLAALTEAAWEMLQARRPGSPKIRIASPDATAHPALAGVSTIEIVNDDMPFLFDSVTTELAAQGLAIGLVAHPVLTVERDADGRLAAFGETAVGASGRRESLIHIHVERIDDEPRRAELTATLEAVLADVRVCVADWRAMRERVAAMVQELKSSPPPLPVDEIAEAVQFLEWLLADNFTLLGVRDYLYTSPDEMLAPVHETALGLLRDREMRILRRGSALVAVTPEVSRFLKTPVPLIVRKSAVRSRVHRAAYMDYIGVKRFDDEGALIGEFRILGLFTSTAYTRSTGSIPYLRRKIAGVLARAGFDPQGHDGKALANVLENYPRDELFQIDDETLYRFATAIMQIEGRPRVRVLARRDEFNRFVSVLVFIPTADFDSDAADAIGRYLAQTYRGHVSARYIAFPEGPNARIHFIVGRRDETTPKPERAELERAVADIVRSWEDGFSAELKRQSGSGRAQILAPRYRAAFPPAYRSAYAPQAAVADLRTIEGLSNANPRGVSFYARGADAGVGLKIWSHAQPVALTERVPVLENMGFRVVDEQTYEISPAGADAAAVFFHDMVLERADAEPVDLGRDKGALEACFLAVMGGAAENDGYNALVLAAGLGWRDVALLRAISRYLRQAPIPFSQDYMWATLRRHGGVARSLVDLFYARFDPRVDSGARDQREAAVAAEIEAALAGVDSLDEDRILRRFVNAVQSGLRTNYFQLAADGRPGPIIAIKFDSRRLDDLPLPRPLVEVSIYSPRVEGVHLRFGRVARGGIRWSDRPQDFRTEVLGLVKAQQVKNAVIVPVGAKGGFVPKLLPKGGSRNDIQEEGIAAYRLFIGALLDITDNIGPDGVIPPRDVVRHDGDDPYLVVAADKGTATFSDIANTLAQAHGFWLDDAFASGGSAGYDHKKMGITARGAWESVKRHFREMDTDIAVAPFTAVGVGDMSGDVFGNGMLRERTTRLIAAFDHRDIFIDPDPDAARAFAERQRLFDLPRSSWQDYDKALLSAGGGVYSRGLKQIDLSAEARRALGLGSERLTPQDAMRAILRAPVDLLFFGGIGTYVRASDETDAPTTPSASPAPICAARSSAKAPISA